MTSPITPVEDGLYNLLTASTALIAALGGTAIYIRDVPVGTAAPYTILEVIRSADLNICPHRLREALIAVQSISTTGAAQAATLDGHCDTALHNSTPTVTGWTSLHCWRQQDMAYRESAPDGREYFHAGGQYYLRYTQA